MFITLSSSIFSISSHSWVGMWIGLEINIISFIPLIINEKNVLSNESSLKYFLIQVLASSLFLLFCLINTFIFYLITDYYINFFFSSLIIIPIIIKLGAAPFHSWFILVREGLNWIQCFILITWQKITPLIPLFFISSIQKEIMLFSILSLLIGSIRGLNQTSLKKILAYSSVYHLGWMFSRIYLSKTLLIQYFSIYIILNFLVVFLFLKNNFNNLNQIFNIKSPITLSFAILSLGGLPPLFGFLPKLIVLQNLILIKIFFISFIMIITALITLYFYLRVIYLNLILTNSFNLWFNKTILNNSSFNSETLIFLISFLGLITFNFF